MNQYWVVIPAAGVGARMQADRPKQYLSLLDTTVIEHSANVFLTHPRMRGVVLVLSPEDSYWPGLALNHEKLSIASGGEERCHSVLNGLEFLSSLADDSDWVLVHDAARPCLQSSDIDKLIEQTAERQQGGLLGLPVADTLKFCQQQKVKKTIDRTGLWRALTPQIFRLGELKQALQQALADEYLVTDEASAMEHAGHEPLMVEGRADNIKITHPQDLVLASIFLRQAKEQA
ncbi:MAG: 2-C-methyl-D-erythritol 4-phosphate cytidylyltransferase [Gammaproteobacteria bacterium]|nr:2-C-methyl-D-erythritol 4-phosphate cytidylyltransferase [Gammaproteobacteria bacterium]